MPGSFYGIGVGPGDPELLTLKAWRILTNVPVISYPVSAGERESLAMSVLARLPAAELLHGKRLLPLYFPMVHDESVLAEHRAKAAEAVMAELLAERDVAFVTLGDPSLYSTYGYLVVRLRELLPSLNVVTVPGVTSFSAAAARAGVALAEGDEKFAIVPATLPEEQLMAALRLFENIAFLKVHRRLDVLKRLLAQKGEGRWRAVLAGRIGFPGEVVTEDLNLAQTLGMSYLTLLLAKCHRLKPDGVPLPGAADGIQEL